MPRKKATKSKKISQPTLDRCLDLLKRPNHDRSPPLSCYQMLEFPRTPKDRRIKPGPHYRYLNKLFRVGIAPPLTVHAKHRIYVPPKFLQTINRKLPQRLIIIPVHFKNSSNTYAILWDRTRRELQVFLPPGSKQVPGHQELEIRFRDLFLDRLKLPVKLFYHAVNYQPPKGTYHADFWPTWLIVQRIRKGGGDRESLINEALEKVLKQSPEYTSFTKDYTNYIINHQ